MKNLDLSTVIIQSRLSSSRLPGKALLPILGIPMVVLAAKRAANTGKSVLVITSDERSDDGLCELLERYNIAFFRGSLDNVLERFCKSLADLNDDTLVFRLTADNVLPDGIFLDEMEIEFLNSDVEIMRCDPEISNMPYGVSAELTTVRCIRDAYANAINDYDKEHVTPYIYRNMNSAVFSSKVVRGCPNLRVTVDSFDDYISVSSLFFGVRDPVNAPIHRLIGNNRKMVYRPYYEPSKKPMTLGSVQFGLDYGITNTNGKIDPDTSIEIIRHAITEGIDFIDTAAAYGSSEEVIGKALQGGWDSRVKVITKLHPFNDDLDHKYTESYWRLSVRNSVLKSCVNLKRSTIDTLMLHRAEHLNNHHIIDELLSLKDEGVVGNIGVSVQNPTELEVALSADYISIIQMPFNILDFRWDYLITSIEQAKEERGLVIHARSALLQGLLCSADSDRWKSVGIDNSDNIVSWLSEKFKEHEKMSVSDLCIGFVNSQTWIDSVVVGVDSKQNLFANLQSISMPFLNEDALSDLRNTRPRVDYNMLDPSKWKINVQSHE